MNMDLNQLIENIQSFFRKFGIQMELLPGAMENEFFLFSLGLFLISFVSFLSLINIIIYTIVLFLSENKKVIEFVSKRPITLKLFNLYKNTRKLYLLTEMLLLLFGVWQTLSITWKVVSGMTSITFTWM